MGRLMTIAVLVAAVAGVITIASGGVDPKPKSAKKAAVATANATRPNAPRPHARVGAVVTMRNLAFTQAHVSIAAGRAVRWVNHDNVEHTVYATIGGDDGTSSFNSRRIEPGQSYESPILANPGVYSYVCTLHPTVMHGVIEVTG
jgi:plastocyanin